MLNLFSIFILKSVKTHLNLQLDNRRNIHLRNNYVRVLHIHIKKTICFSIIIKTSGHFNFSYIPNYTIFMPLTQFVHTYIRLALMIGTLVNQGYAQVFDSFHYNWMIFCMYAKQPLTNL